MTQEQHMQTPWTLGGSAAWSEAAKDCGPVFTCDIREGTHVPVGTNQANARFIVESANNHERYKAALEAISRIAGHRHGRWDTTIDGNCHRQCNPCNQIHINNATIYRDKYIDRFGVPAYEALSERVHSKQKIGYADLLELLEEKEAQLLKLRGKAA